MALVDPQRQAIDCVSRAGYVYRDSGHSIHGLQIYDWLPASEPGGHREVLPEPEATLAMDG